MPNIQPRHAGCCVWTFEQLGNQPVHCERPVAWAGSIEYKGPPLKRVRAFACAEHEDVLLDPQPYGLIPEHELEMERRRRERGRER